MDRLLLLTEFVLLFLVPPALIYFRLLPNFPIPYLLVGTVVAVFLARHDPSITLDALLSTAGLRHGWLPVVLRDLIPTVLLALYVWVRHPDEFFGLPRRQPKLWLLVMFLYPALSVLPQEYLYRSYFFSRYEPLFGSGMGMVFASSLAFAFVHIIFRNAPAIWLSFVGSLLFSLTYLHTGLYLLVCLEHAFYGNLAFSIGLGTFFYRPYGRHPARA